MVRGCLAQAGPGVWWAPSSSAYYVCSASWIKKTYCKNIRGSSPNGFLGQDLGIVSIQLTLVSITQRVAVSTPGIASRYKSGALLQMAHRSCQVTGRASVCGILWHTLWKWCLGSFSGQSGVQPYCSESSMPALWLIIPFTFMALVNTGLSFILPPWIFSAILGGLQTK